MASVLSGSETLTDNWIIFLRQTQGVDPNTIFAKNTAQADSSSGNGFVFRAKSPLDATFDTRANTRQFGKSDSRVGDGGNALLLALAQPDQTKLTLGQVCASFGLNGSGDASRIVDSLFNAIGDKTPLKVSTADGSRNGIWLLPAGSSATPYPSFQPYGKPGDEPVYLQQVTSLTFGLDGAKLASAIGSMADALNSEFGLSLKAPQKIPDDIFSFSVVQTTTGTLTAPTVITLEKSFSVVFTFRLAGFFLRLQYSPSGLVLGLQEDQSVDGDFWTKLSRIMAGDANTSPSTQANQLLTQAPISGSNKGRPQMHLWNAQVTKDFDGGISWSLAIVIDFVINNTPISALLSYESRDGSFSGSLLFGDTGVSSDALLLPTWSPMDVPPRSITTTAAGLDLYDLFPETASLPSNVPHIITDASIAILPQQKPPGLLLSFAVTGGKKTDSDKDPQIPAPFEWDDIRFGVVKTAGVEIAASTSFTLNPRTQEDALKYDPATLYAGLIFNSATRSWSIHGEVKNVQMGVLAGFADPDSSSAFISLLGKLVLRDLIVDYTMQRQVASSFLMRSAIQLGQVELRLVYQYVSTLAFEPGAVTAAANNSDALGPVKALSKPAGSTTTAWSFDAYLGADVEGADLGTIANSIIDGAGDSLPPFVSNIPIGAAADPAKSPISLKVTKLSTTSGAVTKSSLLFSLRIVIDTVDLTFIQIADGGDPASRQPVQAKAKRLLRVSVGKLPLVQDIPVVQDLPQPFDKLQYVWVSASGEAWTAADVDAVNKQLGDAAQLYYKKIKTDRPGDDKPPASASLTSAPPSPPALAVGHHLIVVQNDAVVLDHVFGSPASSTKNSTGNNIANDSNNQPGKDDDKQIAAPEPNPTKGAMQKKTGLLSINAVSLQLEDNHLWINVDATVALGPIEMTLLGFGIGIPLKLPSGKPLTINNLANGETIEEVLSDVAQHIRLKGMGVSFSRPPLLLAGVFQHEQTATRDAYRGGIGISFPPYTFVAVGEYSKVTLINHDYKSVFVFAKLDGPLVTIEFATISGVRLAFGYNSVIRAPRVEELTDFPLIANGGVDGTGNSPINILAKFCGTNDNPGFVTPQEDAFWFALGMTITAFDILAITAAAVLSFRDSGIVLSLYADAVAKMPPGVTDQHEMILYVEIGLVAEMNFIDQYFRCEAALAPTSFLLVPQCHLYGGFALCYWFGSNPHAGDWVFSIGGYHRAFSVPDHYPRPQRLGISFIIGDNINITGEGYFAITPKAVMGGAAIHISLSVGPVSAYLDASFDALINFHPIHYVADMRITVGVECDIDIWFIHIHVSLHIGADLHIEGPEFGGVAHVDFWFFGFNVYFGAHGARPDPLSLDAFWDLVHKAGPQNAIAESKNPANPDVSLKHLLEDGNFPMPSQPDNVASGRPDSTGAGAKWFVKGGSLSFRISADFAINKAYVATATSEQARVSDKPEDKAHYLEKATSVSPTQQVDQTYSTPMQIGHEPERGPIDSYLEVTIRNKAGEVITSWKPTLVVEKLPSALWAPYSPSTDPMLNRRGDNPMLSSSGTNVNLCTGISIKAPDPVLAISKIPQFNATDLHKFGIKKRDGTDWFVPIIKPGEELQPASFPPAQLDTAEQKKDGPTRCADMKSVWVGAANDAKTRAREMASSFASLLEWDQPPPEVQSKLSASSVKPWQLKTDLPTRLVAGTKAGSVASADVVDGLQNFYLALPRVGVAS